MQEKRREIKELEQRVRNLTARLSSSSSDIGDWKVAKCMEYQAMGIDMPYDIFALHSKRQDVRDKINQLQGEIAVLEMEIQALQAEQGKEDTNYGTISSEF